MKNSFSIELKFAPSDNPLGCQSTGGAKSRLTTPTAFGIQDRGTATIGTVRTIAPVVTAPFGTFPGASKLFFAPGAAPLPAEMAAADVQAFQTIDDDGVTRVPPNKQTMTITNLVSGDAVAVFRRTALVINKTQFTLAAGNNKGDTTVVMSGSIPSDNPNVTASKVRVFSDSGEEQRYRYASYTSATFTLVTASTGTATAGDTDTLTDSGATFETDGVEVGDLVRNTADDLFRKVLVVVSETELTTADAGITWNGKTYSINTLVENYTSGNSAYVPIIERIADATSEFNTITFTSPLDVRVDVRNAGVILPFSQDSTIISTGLSVPAIRNTDDIFT